MQRELLGRQIWDSRAQLASANFEWIEAFWNPVRRHTSIGDLSPVGFEALHTAADVAAKSPQPTCPERRVGLLAAELVQKP